MSLWLKGLTKKGLLVDRRITYFCFFTLCDTKCKTMFITTICLLTIGLRTYQYIKDWQQFIVFIFSIDWLLVYSRWCSICNISKRLVICSKRKTQRIKMELSRKKEREKEREREARRRQRKEVQAWLLLIKLLMLGFT